MEIPSTRSRSSPTIVSSSRQDRCRSIKLPAGCNLFQIGRLIAGDGGEHRKYSTGFVSCFAQSGGVLVFQSLSERVEVLWDACVERPAHLLEHDRIATAASEQKCRIDAREPAVGVVVDDADGGVLERAAEPLLALAERLLGLLAR